MIQHRHRQRRYHAAVDGAASHLGEGTSQRARAPGLCSWLLRLAQNSGLEQAQRSAKVTILGVDFDNLSKQELLSRLEKGVVFTPNVDHLMKLRRDADFVSVYQKADFKICDSQILMYAAQFLGKPLKAKLSGADLLPWFCDYHKHNEHIKIFLLGGASGVARVARAGSMLAQVGKSLSVSIRRRWALKPVRRNAPKSSLRLAFTRLTWWPYAGCA